jgi:ankyrin repeat protein
VGDATRAGDLATVERLLTGGAAVDSPGQNGETPLIVAALAGRDDIAVLLLSHGANVNARNAGGFTPLHAAAYVGAEPVASLLLDKGGSLEDTSNKAGATPLMAAAEQNQVAMLELLIARGASVNAPESHGYMPLTRAFWKGHVDVVRLLKRHGATCQSIEVLGSEAIRQKCLAIAD